MKQFKNISELNLSMLMISTSAVLVRFVPLSPLFISVIRAIIALGIIYTFLRIRKTSLKITDKRDLKLILISSVLFAIHWLTYFEALQRSSVAIGMLALFTFPAITSILEPIFLKTPFKIRHLVLALIIVLGMYFIGNAVKFEKQIVSGIGIGIFSALLFSLRNILLKKTQKKYDSGLIMSYHFIIMLALFLPFFNVKHNEKILDYWPYLLFLGIVSTAIGHSLFVKSLSKFNVTTASILCSIQPVYGVLLAYIFLSETPEKQTIFGGIIILSTVFIEAILDAKSKKKTWYNWTKEVKSTPEHIAQPTSLDELYNLVEKAVKENKKIKVVGSGHSCSKIAQTNQGLLISPQKLNKIISIDKTKKIVEVEAGITIEKLSEQLLKNQLAMSNMGTIAKQTISGALSTGTHGSGSKIGSIDQSVHAIEIITEQGVKFLDYNDKKTLNAVKVGLGSLGVISKVWLKVEDSFKLKAESEAVSFDQMILKLGEKKTHRHARFWWAPYPNKVQYWFADKTNEDIKKPSILKHWLKDVFVGNFIHELLLYLTTFNKKWLKHVNNWVFKTMFEKPSVVIDNSFQIFTLPIKVKQTVMEYALPADKAQAVLKDIKKCLDEKEMIVHLPIEVRFAPKNEAWLSMANQRDTVYIGIICYQPFGKKINHENYFKMIHEIFKKYEGRPHWAKKHYYTSQELANLYPMWKDFKELSQNWNPKQLFANKWIDKTFKF